MRSNNYQQGLSPLELLLLATAYGHVLLNPYTKVEESFSLHAVRDILSLGFKPQVLPFYDHVEFPGAVPRSFIGPLLLSAFSWPFVALGSALSLWTNELAIQILIRLVLATLACTSLLFLARRVRTAFGSAVARTTLLLTITQFHLLFWVSRTLPNMFAFPLVQVATGLLLAPQGRRTRKGKGSYVEVLVGFGILTFAAIVLRLELCALLAPLVLESLWSGTAGVRELFIVGLSVAGGSVGLTLGLDSYFWNRLVWPEGASILYNVVGGQASNWGVSPWHYYFTSSLPRLLNLALPFSIFAMLIDRRARRIGIPALAFVCVLSFLPHKEWRFFVYAVPSLNICAAAGIQSLQVLFSPSHKRLALRLTLIANLLLTILALYASSKNYPGGRAMSHLSLLQSSDPVPRTIHIDSHSAMTGASRFHHPHSSKGAWYLSPPSIPWAYNRSESLESYNGFDYLVTGDAGRHLFAGESGRRLLEGRGGEWEVAEVFRGWEGWREGMEGEGSVGILRRVERE